MKPGDVVLYRIADEVTVGKSGITRAARYVYARVVDVRSRALLLTALPDNPGGDVLADLGVTVVGADGLDDDLLAQGPPPGCYAVTRPQFRDALEAAGAKVLSHFRPHVVALVAEPGDTVRLGRVEEGPYPGEWRERVAGDLRSGDARALDRLPFAEREAVLGTREAAKAARAKARAEFLASQEGA